MLIKCYSEWKRGKLMVVLYLISLCTSTCTFISSCAIHFLLLRCRLGDSQNIVVWCERNCIAGPPEQWSIVPPEKWSIIPPEKWSIIPRKMVHYSAENGPLFHGKMVHYSAENGPLFRRKNGPLFHRKNGPFFPVARGYSCAHAKGGCHGSHWDDTSKVKCQKWIRKEEIGK